MDVHETTDRQLTRRRFIERSADTSRLRYTVEFSFVNHARRLDGQRKGNVPRKKNIEIEGKCALVLLALLLQEEKRCAELRVI